MAKTRTKSLGAASDDPMVLVNRAIRQADAAIERNDLIGIREASELGWLAASSTADVASAKLKLRIPSGAKGRRAVLDAVEERAKLRKGTLIGPFEGARAVLHGECFHGDVCSPRSVQGLLNEVKQLVADTRAAVGRIQSKRR